MQYEKGNLNCAVPEKIHTYFTEGYWKFQGRRVPKAKIFKGTYEAKTETSRGVGEFKPNHPLLGRYAYFLENMLPYKPAKVKSKTKYK